jgi:hypothetical protein
MPTNKKPDRANVQVKELESAGGTFSLYSNRTQVVTGPWDIRFQFGEIVGNDGDSLLMVKHGSIVMSPGHAKAFLEVFQDTLKKYEERFGEIDVSRFRQEAQDEPDPSE